jgi:hypothetical protein
MLRLLRRPQHDNAVVITNFKFPISNKKRPVTTAGALQ